MKIIDAMTEKDQKYPPGVQRDVYGCEEHHYNYNTCADCVRLRKPLDSVQKPKEECRHIIYTTVVERIGQDYIDFRCQCGERIVLSIPDRITPPERVELPELVSLGENFGERNTLRLEEAVNGIIRYLRAHKK